MNPIISKNIVELRALCRRYRVSRLELFGSAATNVFDSSSSDLDFLVKYLPGSEEPWMGEYFGLKRDLEKLMQRSVDLVVIGAIRNPYFMKSASVTRTTLYAA